MSKPSFTNRPGKSAQLNSGANKRCGILIRYTVLILVGFFMVYPLLWMIGATFKTNNEIFSSVSPFTANPTLDGYRNALHSYGGQINLLKALLNSYCYILPKVLFTVISCTLTAYGFARFTFRGKKVLFALLVSTLFLPQAVMNVPQFILFEKFGWVDSPLYLPLVLPALFAFDTYFVFMLIQFLRGIPRDLDEAATIDGCNSFQTLWYILCPLLRPAIISCALFQFMWSSNDFMGPLLYVNTPARYPATIFVKLFMDADAGFDWNRVLAVSLISILPQLVLFFVAQRRFVDGIATGSMKE